MTDVVFLEANSTGTTYSAMKLVKDAGSKITFLTHERDFYHTLPENPLDLADRIIDVDTYDSVAVLRSLGHISYNGLIAYDDYRLPTAALCANALNLPAGNVPSLLRARFKDLTRLAMMGQPDAIPFALVKNHNCIGKELNRLKFPVIAKPTDESGSVAVRRCDNINQLRDTLTNSQWGCVNQRGYRRSHSVLVEEYVDGPEFSCELYWCHPTRSWNVVGITEKLADDQNLLVESGHVFPAEISTDTAKKCQDAVISWLQSVKLVSGAAHIEFKIDQAGTPRLIEINPRLPGGNITELVELVTGVDVSLTYLNFHLLNPISKIHQETIEIVRVAASVYFSTYEIYDESQVGELRRFLKDLPGVVRFRFGNIIKSAPHQPVSNYDRVGYAILTAETHAEMKELILHIRKKTMNLSDL